MTFLSILLFINKTIVNLSLVCLSSIATHSNIRCPKSLTISTYCAGILDTRFLASDVIDQVFRGEWSQKTQISIDMKIHLFLAKGGIFLVIARPEFRTLCFLNRGLLLPLLLLLRVAAVDQYSSLGRIST